MAQPTRPSQIQLSDTFHTWRREINKAVAVLNYYILEEGFKAYGATINDSTISDSTIQQSTVQQSTVDDSYVQNSKIQDSTYETGRIEEDVEIVSPEIKGEWNFNKHSAEIRVPFGTTEDRENKGTGKVGELFFDTDTKRLYVFDGSAVGGQTFFGSRQPDGDTYALRTGDGRIKASNATDPDDTVPLNQTEDLIEDHTSIPLVDGAHGTKLVEDLSEEADAEYEKISTNETVKSYIDSETDNLQSNLDEHTETDLTDGAHGTKLVKDLSEEADAEYEKISTNETVKAYVDSRKTDDIDEGIDNLYYTEERVNTVIDSRRGSTDGIASLDSSGLILESELPAIAITNTTVVDTITDRDNLSDVKQGDIVIVEDATDDELVDEGPASYIWSGSEWKKLRIPLNQIQEAKQYTDNEISSHSDETTSVHGVTDGNIESTVGAQDKADAAETAAKDAALLKEDNLDDLTNVSDARNNLGLENGATTKFHFSSDSPEESDGEDGDIWFQYFDG